MKKLEIAIIILSLMTVALVCGCEAESPFKNAKWILEGTYCSECSILYNLKAHNICPECNSQTKKFFYLAKIEDVE